MKRKKKEPIVWFKLPIRDDCIYCQEEIRKYLAAKKKKVKK